MTSDSARPKRGTLSWRSKGFLFAPGLILRFTPAHPTALPRDSQCLCGLRCSALVIESPNRPNCHPEREGGGWGGREGSPHKSRCRPTVIAEILRSPRAHPPIAQDDTKFTVLSSPRFSDRAVKKLRMTLNTQGEL